MCKIIKQWGRNSKKIVFLENKLKNRIKKEFKAMANEIAERLEVLGKLQEVIKVEQKQSLEGEILKIIWNYCLNITDWIVENSLKSVNLGYSFISNSLKVDVNFNEIEQEMQNYFTELYNQVTTLANDWIAWNTANRILWIVAQWWLEGRSYRDIAKQIRQQATEWILSPARAEMIAINQIGKWYEEGKRKTINNYITNNPWDKVEKQWVTVWDSRVTESHKRNARDWWITLNETFSWTRDLNAPWSDNPRCRCSVVYRII